MVDEILGQQQVVVKSMEQNFRKVEGIAVDTHVFRVSNRTGLAPGKTVEAVEKRLLKVTPPEFLQHAHHWLILHGRYVCVARAPKCGECLIRDLCVYRAKSGAA